MHRRRFLSHAVMTLPALARLAACGPLPTAPARVKRPPATIRFVMGPFANYGFGEDVGDQQQADQELVPPLIESFQRTFPDVTVETVKVTDYYAFQQYATLYFDSAAGSHADVALVRGWGGPVDVTKVIPLEPLLKRDSSVKPDDFYPQAIHRATYQSHLIGLPRDIEPNMLVVYNADLLSQAGAPAPSTGWTMGEFLTTTQQLTRVFASRPEPGMHFGFADSYGLDGLYAFILSFGGALYDRATGKVTIDSEAAVAGAQFYADLRNKYHALPTRAEHLTAYGAESPLTQFVTGTVPMFGGSPDVIAALRHVNKALSWDVTTMPVKADVKQNWNAISSVLLIPKASTQQDAAWDLVKYLAVGPGMESRAAIGDLHPAHKKLATGPAWLNQEPPSSRSIFNTVGMDRMVDVDPKTATVVQGTPAPGTLPDYNAMHTTVYRGLDDLLTGKVSAQQLLQQAAQAANKPLTRGQ